MTQYDEFDDDVPAPSFAEAPEDARATRGVRIRYWIITLLVAMAVGLFAVDRFIVLVQPNLESLDVQRDSASVRSLEQAVVEVLDGYGITDTWIKRKTVSLPAAEHVRSLWLISVPSDVPLASINHDLTRLASGMEGRAFAVEDAKTRQVFVHVRFRNMILYSLVFTPDRSMRRGSGGIAMLIDGIERASSRDIEQYLASREPVACILIPERKSQDLYEQLVLAGKEIVLHIHVFPGDVEKSRFVVTEAMNREEAAARARSIMRSFARASSYYVTSDRASSVQATAIDAVLSGAGMQRIETAGLIYIDRTSQFSTMSSRMNDLSVLAARQGRAAGVVELRDDIMTFLTDDMMRLRKKGLEFISVRRYLEASLPDAAS